MDAPLVQSFADRLTAGAECDTFAIVEELDQLDPASALEVYDRLQRDLYWQRKAVQPVIAVSRAGIQHALAAARRCADGSAADAFRGKAKTLAYNLASFTWPGWAEPGIALTRSDQAVGLDAARLNLRLATQLGRPAKAVANAHWMLGAHLLSLGQLDGAAIAFETAESAAEVAGESLLVLMLAGYRQLARSIAHPADESARRAFEERVAALRNTDAAEAVGYADQLVTARSSLG